MISSLYFQYLSLIYMVLLSVVVFSKQRLKSIENSFFKSLIIINLVGLVLDIASTYIAYVDLQNILLTPISKAYLLYLIFVCLVFTMYVLFVAFIDKSAEHNQKKSIVQKMIIVKLIIFSVITLIISIVPLYNVSENGIIYTEGPGANLTYAVVGVCILIWITSLIINYKNIKDKKYLPIFTLIICIIGAALLQNTHPELLIITAINCFVIYIMFFTIENPDMKLINELNIARERAVKANNSKSDFLSSMSHEIRTPLNAIVGFSQVLISDNKIPEDSKSEIKDIVMASETLLNIVNGILDISKIEANKLEIINSEYSTKKMLDDLVSLTKARMGSKPLKLRTYFDPTIPDYLYGDVSRLKQIILNLLTNSVKYTKEGYVDFRINVVNQNDICKIIIAVEDTGVGIKPEDINKLFNKFERINEGNTSTEGTGLGLAITKKLTELMGGQIVVQSVYGKGSKFTVAVAQKIINKPIEKEDDTLDKTKLIKTLDFSSKKVLIVDDNKLNLKVAQRLLNLYGINVEMVESGFEFIEKYKEGNKYDLILLDDMMPELSGVETLHKLKEDPNYNMPTIALTANAIEGMREKYLKDGFDDYLAKPIDKNELNRVILKYLHNDK